jgi:hypothetical protein
MRLPLALVAALSLMTSRSSADAVQYVGAWWGFPGAPHGSSLNSPEGLTTDDSNYVYVADGVTGRVLKLTGDGV